MGIEAVHGGELVSWEKAESHKNLERARGGEEPPPGYPEREEDGNMKSWQNIWAPPPPNSSHKTEESPVL